MDPIYRLLGIAAYSTEVASRTSGNGIPVNWLFMILLGFFCGITIKEAVDVKRNEGEPIKTSVREISPDHVGRYITLTGAFFEEGSLIKADKYGKPKDESEAFIPLVDPEKQKSIFVKVDSDDDLSGVVVILDPSESIAPDAKLSRTINISGVLRRIDNDLKKKASLSSPLGTTALNDQHMLVAGPKPKGFAMYVAIASALGAVVLIMLFVVLKRYVIFRPQPRPRHGVDLPAIAPGSQEKFDLRVTAQFQLDDRVRQRFHRVPAVVAELQSGDMALLANVDASVDFMGAKTEDRSGIWAAVIAKGTLSQPEFGTLYFGLTAYPAFRIRYTDALKKTPATAILASTTVAGRERVREALYDPRATPAPVATPTEEVPT
jgi:hypothetical protein